MNLLPGDPSAVVRDEQLGIESLVGRSRQSADVRLCSWASPRWAEPLPVPRSGGPPSRYRWVSGYGIGEYPPRREIEGGRDHDWNGCGEAAGADAGKLLGRVQEEGRMQWSSTASVPFPCLRGEGWTV